MQPATISESNFTEGSLRGSHYLEEQTVSSAVHILGDGFVQQHLSGGHEKRSGSVFSTCLFVSTESGISTRPFGPLTLPLCGSWIILIFNSDIFLIHPPEKPPTDSVFKLRSKLFMDIHVHNFPRVSIWVFKSVYFRIEGTLCHLKDISTLRCSLDLTTSLLCRTRERMEPKQELQMTLEPFEIQAKQAEAGEVAAKCRMESNLNGPPTVWWLWLIRDC